MCSGTTVYAKLRSAFLVLAMALGFFHRSAAQTPFNVRFESPVYAGSDNSSFTAKILVDPVPAEKLFSYGVLVYIVGANGVVGTGAISAAPEFNFNGPLGSPALAGTGIGVAAVKGTSDFFSDAVPSLADQTLATLTLQQIPAGDYTLTLHPHFTLGTDEQLFVQGDMAVADSHITFGSATLHVAQVPGTVQAIGNLVVDAQSGGLLVQTVRITNTLTRIPAGIRLWIDNLPPIVTAWNAYGTINGMPYIDYLPALQPGQSVDLSVQFFPKDRSTIPAPVYSLQEINPPLIPPVIGPTQQIQPRLKLSNGYNLLEFSTTLGVKYFVQYSTDLNTWKTAQPAVMGIGITMQWIDDGPPRTESKPNQGPFRYYRVVTAP